MCGRFINLTKANTLKKIFNIKNSNNKDLLSYNISPSQNSQIIYKEKIINLGEAKWGYSFFDKKNYQEKKIINSRLETINEKILFKESYYKRKCIVPVNGYYEWSMLNDVKIPFFVHLPPSEPMYLAGIWKYNNNKKGDIKVFSIITKIANKHIAAIHHRMPILLSIEEGDNFLNDNKSIFLTSNHTSKIEQELDFYPVSNFVNNPLNNSKKCIEFIN